jgi:hypothetical protein
MRRSLANSDVFDFGYRPEQNVGWVLEVPMHRVVVLGVLAAGCGGGALTASGGALDASVDASADAAGPDASGEETMAAETDAGTSVVDANGDAGDAEADGPTCDDLHQTAQTSFSGVISANRGCSVASDCAFVTSPGRCLNSCSYAVNEAGVSAATASAAEVCAGFNARGCSLPVLLCPARSALTCDGGICAFAAN